MHTKPIFVVDRPASLRILSGLSDQKGKFGILAHAFTTDNFKRQFAEFDLAAFKIGDSGIYQKKKDVTYPEIFQSYENMKVDYGIIMDHYRDRKSTYESAKKAIKVYKRSKYSFQLVGVAHGKSVSEYLKSYKEQKELGFEVVAIGGLLDKIQKHVRLVRVKHDVMLRNVLRAIRINYPDDRILPLGVFNRKRLQFFKEIGVWASDYKGWIFQYDKTQADLKDNRFEQTRKYVKEMILKPLSWNDESIYWEASIQPNKNDKRLLIMACGKVKKNEPGKAIDVYNGPSFKMVRKYLKFRNNHLDIKIISAKYGLIDYKDRISPYDLKLNSKSSEIYKEVYSSDLKGYLNVYREIFVLGGKDYQSVIPGGRNVMRAKGKIGMQLSQLKKWLNDDKISETKKDNKSVSIET